MCWARCGVPLQGGFDAEIRSKTAVYWKKAENVFFVSISRILSVFSPLKWTFYVSSQFILGRSSIHE
jgi:hypothetical protein